MSTSTRRLRATVVLLTVALAGLVLVQAILLRQAWDLKEQAFARNVRAALAQTVQQLDACEIARGAGGILFDLASTDTNLTVVHRSLGAGGDSVHFAFVDTLHEIVAGDSLVRWTTGESLPHGGYMAVRLEDEASVRTEQFDVTIETERGRLIRRVVGDLIEQAPRPVAERLADSPVDSVLDAQLAAAGVGVDATYAVLTAGGGDSVVIPPESDPAAFAASPFRARLFPLDLVPPHYELALVFPGKTAYLLKQNGPLLAASLILLAVVVSGFFHTVRSLLERRRFAAQVVDFVNNMTHEFKTPLSTLTLANEAIARGGGDDPALARHTTMIREETERLGRQVERILQLAQLEKGELVLHAAPLDGNRLVQDAVRACALGVEQRGGTLACRCDAARAPLHGDEVHLAGVLANLLDNAVKYSPEPPEITVAAAVRGGEFVITVADRGPGVPRADRERVFEPYFRCPTGNRHDVKGHGLGLGYARLIVEAHGGRIALDANPGGGARVTLRLPLADRGAPREAAP